MDTLPFSPVTANEFGHTPVPSKVKAYWFNERTHRAKIVEIPSVVFKFQVWNEQCMNGTEDTVLFTWDIQGTLSFVTKEPDIFHTQFTLDIFDPQGQHVATLKECMFTVFSQEYSLDTQHIVESEFIATSMKFNKDE